MPPRPIVAMPSFVHHYPGGVRTRARELITGGEAHALRASAPPISPPRCLKGETVLSIVGRSWEFEGRTTRQGTTHDGKRQEHREGDTWEKEWHKRRGPYFNEQNIRFCQRAKQSRRGSKRDGRI